MHAYYMRLPKIYMKHLHAGKYKITGEIGKRMEIESAV